jgi:hypothetical protein
MSRAFARFLSELRAQWPEKKDGFDSATLRLHAHLGVIRQQAITSTRHLWSAHARLDLLLRVLDEEPDAMNRMMAAGELLQALGRAPGDGRAPEYRVALDGLRSADADFRRRTLAQLGMGDA